MKKYLSKSNVLLAFLFILCIAPISNHARAQGRAVVSLQVFYDELDPYGNWIYDGRYGYVWVPDDGDDFQPYYSNGYWEMTEYGNTWISLYAWGWAPFHYGRWTYDSFYGWVWVPGFEWAPAWVCWRHGGGYFGWAPLSPYFTITVGLGAYDCPGNWWIFAPVHYLYGQHHHSHYIVRNDELVHHTTIVPHTQSEANSNVIYPAGPSAEEVRAETGKEVPIRKIQEVDQPLRNEVTENDLRLYRPDIKTKNDEAPSAPKRVHQENTPITSPQPIRIPTEKRPGVIAPRIFRPEPARQRATPIQSQPGRNRATDQPGTPKTQPRQINPSQPRTAPVQRSRNNTEINRRK